MSTLSKRVVSLVSAAILIASVSPSTSPALARAQHVSQVSTSPDEVVRKFYDWYLHAGLPSPERKNLATFQKYTTRRLLKRQMDPEVDADVFVDAQDFDETWKDDFSVSKPTIRGEQSTVLVNLKGKHFSYQLHVTLRRETGLWKIDNVKGNDWKNP